MSENTTSTVIAKLALTAGLGLTMIGGAAVGAGAETPANNGPGFGLSNGEITDPEPEPEPKPGPADIAAQPSDPDPEPKPNNGPKDISDAPDDGPGPHDGPGDLSDAPDDDDPRPADGPGDLTDRPDEDPCDNTTICDLTDRPADPEETPEETPEDTEDPADNPEDQSTEDPEDAQDVEAAGTGDALAFTGTGSVLLAALGSTVAGLGVAFRRFSRRMAR